jgi:hypothetical protein
VPWRASILLSSMLNAYPKDMEPSPAEPSLTSSECGALPTSEVELSAFFNSARMA